MEARPVSAEPPVPPPPDIGEPEAVITRRGRFWYEVTIRQGVMAWPGWRSGGGWMRPAGGWLNGKPPGNWRKPGNRRPCHGP